MKEHPYAYMVLVVLGYFSYGGANSIFPTISGKIYGIKNGTQVASLFPFALSISSILSYVLSTYVVKPGKEQNVLYVGAVLSFINIILAITIDEGPIQSRFIKNKQTGKLELVIEGYQNSLILKWTGNKNIKLTKG